MWVLDVILENILPKSCQEEKTLNSYFRYNPNCYSFYLQLMLYGSKIILDGKLNSLMARLIIFSYVY